MSPSWLLVWALKPLQNSMMLTPCWPRAGPTGGDGLAFPAVIWSLTIAWTFFAMLEPLHLVVLELDGREAPEDRHHDLELAPLRVQVVDRALEVHERSLDHPHLVALLEGRLELRLLGAFLHLPQDPLHLFGRQRHRPGARRSGPATRCRTRPCSRSPSRCGPRTTSWPPSPSRSFQDHPHQAGQGHVDRAQVHRQDEHHDQHHRRGGRHVLAAGPIHPSELPRHFLEELLHPLQKFHALTILAIWQAWRDSNPHPPDLESGALAVRATRLRAERYFDSLCGWCLRHHLQYFLTSIRSGCVRRFLVVE